MAADYPELPMSTEPNHPEELTAVSNEPEAAAIIVALAERGIEATVTGNFIAGFHALIPSDVKVVVKNEDLARAKKALEEIGRDCSDIDWSQVDVGEPE